MTFDKWFAASVSTNVAFRRLTPQSRLSMRAMPGVLGCKNASHDRFRKHPAPLNYLTGIVSALLLAATAQAADSQVRVLSSPAWAVTGGNALIEIPALGRVTVNGKDVTEGFQRQIKSEGRVGLISGLRDGRNRLEVADGARAKLTLINYPLSGPVFSGPHQTPFVCETHAFKLPDGAFLGPSGPDCGAPTNVQYLYKSTADGQLKPYNAQSVAASEIAKTTIKDGASVDYIVRLETGVVNRAIYQVSMLAKPGDKFSPVAPPPGWNGRLIYAFGGGCGAAYRQGRATVGVINHPEFGNDPLDQGYAIATATLNVLGQNCNDVTSAETAMMVKERFIETFGAPRFTIGWGGSGGSMQQNLIQANYPGILDGLIPERSFPDTLSTLVSSADCPLLHNYLQNAAGWSEAQKTAVVGFPSYEHCAKAWFNYMPRWLSPLGSGCDSTAFVTAQEGGAVAGTKVEQTHKLYDPRSSPDGVRCGYFDNAVNIWGRNPDGSARTPIDNVGVQYGLDAFNRGVISFEQFLDLNRHVGGFSADANIIPQRMKANPQALRIAYATGRISQGYGLDGVPIIDLRSYLDNLTPADVHTSQTTDIARARLQAANGHSANFIIWVTASSGSLRGDMISPTTPMRVATREAIAAMDAWLLAIEQDSSQRSAAQKVIANRPKDLQDACFDAQGQRHDLASAAGKSCMASFPSHGDPRMAAGEPLTRLHAKCALTPVRASRYASKLSAQQETQLGEAFPEGVCDYQKPPVGITRPAGTWLAYPEPGRHQEMPR
jgi:hypothetical protein